MLEKRVFGTQKAGTCVCERVRVREGKWVKAKRFAEIDENKTKCQNQ